ncbi:MAG TPA: terminase family protein, partial [Hypericibacter adhaerens]|uniref:terminase large subunit domain-containing protein n=1 Tax=Hypericibacter adhaerens TaxID=2602016 RepID=UPI002C648B71
MQQALHEQMRRFNVVVCHRRFGKTVLCVNHLIRAAASCLLPRPRFAYLAPSYRQAKAVAWDYLKHFTGPIPGALRHEGELRIDLPNGARIALLGADNPDALRGLYIDGIVFDEYGQMAPRIFGEVVRPALADRQGWAIFIGTPQGRNGFHEIYEAARLDPDWFTALHRASETGLIEAEELAAARRVMTPEEYAQEFECSFEAAAAGSYYGRLIEAAAAEGRIAAVPCDPRLPVHTAWDLGMDDSTAIWFAQAAGAEVRLVGYYEASGEGLEHYVRVLQQRGFVYGEHWLPHDAEVRELGTGVSRIETLASLGLRARVLPALRIEDGVNAA